MTTYTNHDGDSFQRCGHGVPERKVDELSHGPIGSTALRGGGLARLPHRWTREQAEGVHPEDRLTLVGDRHRDDADEIVIQSGVFCVCLFGAGLCGFVLAFVSWLIH